MVPGIFLGAGGFRSVLNLWRNGADRKLNWNWLNSSNRWNRNYRFAGVRYCICFLPPSKRKFL